VITAIWESGKLRQRLATRLAKKSVQKQDSDMRVLVFRSQLIQKDAAGTLSNTNFQHTHPHFYKSLADQALSSLGLTRCIRFPSKQALWVLCL
jgi:hypothetical protein